MRQEKIMTNAKMNVNVTKMALALLLSGSVMVSAQATDFNQLHKQMDIFADIIKSNSKSNDQGHSPSIRSIENYYFDGQGAVFRVTTSNRHVYSINTPYGVTPVAAPVAPLPPEGFDGEALFGEDFEIVIEEALEQAEIEMEIVHEHARVESEEYHKLREEERELAYQLRDLERSKRDLAYQKAQGSENKSKLEKDMKDIEKQKQEVAKKKEKLQLKAKERKEKVAEQRKERALEKKAYYGELQTKLSQVLCDYGNGLKALPKSEQVSFVLKGAGDKSNNRTKDQVISFKKSDIRACVTEKIDAKKLLAKANKYQF